MTIVDFRAERIALLGSADVVGAALRAELTALADRWLGALLMAAATDDTDGVALVAVGGFGRGEPAPHSDLDLVLVHRDRRDISELAERIWYPIWDSGVALDHSVRTVAEAVGVAAEDLKAALGLLDARHVAGDPTLSADLRERIYAAWRAGASRRLPQLVAATRERGERMGDASFLLEPDIKECRGGLRDHQAMRSAAATWVVDAPTDDERAAYTLLLDVRGELHRRTGRATDQLLLQEQDAVAPMLGYADADALLASVYGAARTTAFALDVTVRRIEAWLPDAQPRRLKLGRQRQRTATPRRPLADGVIEQGGEVVLARDADPAVDPVLLLRVAAAAAEHGLAIAPHALLRLQLDGAAVPEPWSPAARNAFLALLGAGRGAVPVIEALDQAGLVTRLLPEWEHVRFRPQRNAVHRFTVDRHLIEAVVESSVRARRVSRPDLLLLGALLHDIGKGQPGDHTDAGVVMAGRIAPRLGLDEADSAVVVSLVRNHLLLPDTATRRDLDDPVTIATVAEAVGRSRTTLELLHALTEADAQATGPAAWSEWKAGLINQLVARVAAALEGDALPTTAPLTPEQHELVARGGIDLAATPTVAGAYAVTVVAPDHPGVLWRSAGVLALHRLDVHTATATSAGESALTLFTVSPRYGAAPDWRLVRDDLRAALDGTLPLAERLEERERAYAATPTTRSLRAAPKVLFFDDAAEVASVVEVRAHDALGLLHRIGRALDMCGLDVRTARVSTLGAEAVDAFYVVDASGGKISDVAERDRIEAAILGAITTPAGP